MIQNWLCWLCISCTRTTKYWARWVICYPIVEEEQEPISPLWLWLDGLMILDAELQPSSAGTISSSLFLLVLLPTAGFSETIETTDRTLYQLLLGIARKPNKCSRLLLVIARHVLPGHRLQPSALKNSSSNDGWNGAQTNRKGVCLSDSCQGCENCNKNKNSVSCSIFNYSTSFCSLPLFWVG